MGFHERISSFPGEMSTNVERTAGDISTGLTDDWQMTKEFQQIELVKEKIQCQKWNDLFKEKREIEWNYKSININE